MTAPEAPTRPRSRRYAVTVDTLVARLLRGDRRAAARLISVIENGAPDQLRAAAEQLTPHAGRAAVIGVTGAPGVGKSTLCDALIGRWRQAGRTVGVLAVDPSSPLTGGALLGDRVRMQRHALDEGVFIRSMASRGHLGGLAASTAQAVRVLDAAGCDLVVVETVGVGQAEVDVAGLADTTLVVLAPGLGDAVQVAKAGILEIADVFVVNKADASDAGRLARDLRQMLHLGAATPWQVPVVSTTADRAGAALDPDTGVDPSGVTELAGTIVDHQRHLDAGGGRQRRRGHRAAREIEALVLAELRGRLGRRGRGEDLDGLAAQVAAGRIGPYTAADRILAEFQKATVPPTNIKR